MIWFTSDLHFGHHNILRYDNRPFVTIEDMDRTIIHRWKARVKETDTIYILGDVSWYNVEKTIEIFKDLPGHKILIKGNHDGALLKSKEFRDLFDGIYDYKELYFDKKTMVTLCHYPVMFFNKSFYGQYMFYGHVHNSHEWNFLKNYKQELESMDLKCNMFNVGCMCHNYTPVSFEEITGKTLDSLTEVTLN